MKQAAIVLVVLGCLFQLRGHYETYLLCRAGLPNGINHAGGNDPRAAIVEESTWRRHEAVSRGDPSLWNQKEGTDIAVSVFSQGWTRDEAMKEGFITAGNPIRPLTAEERQEMQTKLVQWSYYNRALEMYHERMIRVVLLGFPWLLAYLGFAVVWCMHRQFIYVLVVPLVPVLFFASAKYFIRLIF